MKIIAFTGAGISKQSHIPTFLEQPDVRDKLFRSYATAHPEDYNKVIRTMKEAMDQAEPNDAHIALAEYNIPIITMNIDGLHKKAGSQALEIHGTMPDDNELDIAYSLYNKPVLYGDAAPMYNEAIDMVNKLEYGSYFIVIGCSFHTSISVLLRDIARNRGAHIIEIQEDAARNVRLLLEDIVAKQ